MTKDEKIAFLSLEAHIEFCCKCDEPIWLEDWNTPYYHNQENNDYLCRDCGADNESNS